MQSVFYFASPFFFSSFPMKFLYLLCFLLPLIFWACAPDRQTLRLEGEIKGIDQADLLVCEAESSIDTVGLDQRAPLLGRESSMISSTSTPRRADSLRMRPM